MSKKLHKRKIRIKKGAPLPPVSVTDGYKDFSKVLGTYTTFIRDIHTKPLYKRPGLFLGLFLIVVVAVLVFSSLEEEKTNENNLPEKPELELIDSVNPQNDSANNSNTD